MLPQALKSCPKSYKLPNLVTLVGRYLGTYVAGITKSTESKTIREKYPFLMLLLIENVVVFEKGFEKGAKVTQILGDFLGHLKNITFRVNQLCLLFGQLL